MLDKKVINSKHWQTVHGRNVGRGFHVYFLTCLDKDMHIYIYKISSYFCPLCIIMGELKQYFNS